MENTETTVAPTEAEGVLPEVEQVTAETPEQGEESLDQSADEQPTEDREAKAVKSLQRRLGKRTADYYRAQARAEQLEQELAKMRGDGDGQPEPEQVHRLIQQEAERLAAAKEKASKVDAVERELRKAVPDYEDFYADLASNGPAAAKLLEAVVELDEAPKVLAHLATNREELYSVMELSGTRQAVALAKIAARLEVKPPKVSTAPPPVRPVGSRAGSTGLDDSLPLDEWMKRRNSGKA